MHIKHSLWSTDIYNTMGDLDTDVLFEKCQQHQKQHPTVTLSNRGGYQGHDFRDTELLDLITKNIPTVAGKTLPKIQIQVWVNINGFGHWNTLHNHLDEQVMISGIYYVKSPANSGDIYFYDPRYFSTVGSFYRYYATEDDNGGYIQIKPQENMLLFFPPSLFHMVGPNLSQEQRCSIAFNVLVVPGQKF